MNPKIFAIRRAVLLSLYQFGNPVSLNTLLFCPKLRDAFERCGGLTGGDTLLLRRELDALCDAGYIQAIAGFEGWYKLSDEQRSQLLQADGKLDRSDALLYGPAALR